MVIFRKWMYNLTVNKFGQ